MRTMMDAGEFGLFYGMVRSATFRCPVAPVLNWLPLARLGSVLSEALLGSLINSAAAAPLLSTHPPTQRDRAFPWSAHFLTRGRGCRCPWETIGSPAMITRMLQPPSPSRDLFPEFLQTVTTQYTEFFLSQTEVKSTTRSCWLPRLTSRQLHKCPRMASSAHCPCIK